MSAPSSLFTGVAASLIDGGDAAVPSILEVEPDLQNENNLACFVGRAWFNTMHVLVLRILYTLQNRPTLSKITLSNHLFYSLLCRP